MSLCSRSCGLGWSQIAFCLVFLVMASGCATQLPENDLAYYQKMVAKHPNNQIYKLELQRAEFLKEQAVNRQAQEFINLERYQLAKQVVESGLTELPDSLILTELNEKLIDLTDSKASYEVAIALVKEGKVGRAIEELQKAVRLNPANEGAFVLLKRIKKREIPHRSSDTIDLNFEKLELRSAIEFIARSYGIHVIFDDGVKDMPITLELDNLDFYQALDIMLQMSRHYFKVVDQKTIIVYPDSKDKRAQYEELVLRAIQLEFINVKDMAAILKAVLDVRDITLNESSNLLMIRETPQVMGLIEQLIMINDVPQPQVLLDVEILEINKSKSKQLGTDFGSYQIGLSTDPIPLRSSILGTINETSELTIPTVTLKALKQDVNAKILANPKIRVVNQQEAKIHIGDRVPLRSSSILDATGQTRTTFEYQEIGIRLAVKPQIHPNNDTTLKVSLEVSALGENLGTTDEPAFRIGSRNAETIMVLNDGESVLLGGLIREEERRSFSTIPGLDRHSVLRELFSFSDESAGRTDVLLTITPRVIRGNRLNEVLHDLELDTGTLERTYAPSHDEIYKLKVGKPVFKTIDEFQQGNELGMVVDGQTSNKTAMQESERELEAQARENAPVVDLPSLQAESDDELPEIDDASPVVSVQPSQQAVSVGDEVKVQVQASSLSDLSMVSSSLLFNPNLLQLEKVVALEPFATKVTSESVEGGNAVDIDVDVNPALNKVTAETGVVEVTFKAVRKGTSFIVLKTPVLQAKSGERQGGVAKNGRITVN